jgi:predicted nucleotidyltransferase component of viral defense system
LEIGALLKLYNQTRIKRSEIAQLIVLHHIFSHKRSVDLFFQGGTALRWCYGGARFSEDLDFVTIMTTPALSHLLKGLSRKIRADMIAHFGKGDFLLNEKENVRDESYRSFIEFKAEKSREKISVKVEFERLKEALRPDASLLILSSLPAVGYLLGSGEFKIPTPSSILQVETLEEILSDKIRALMERTYVKGRDYYDVWFLTCTLGVEVNVDLVKRKLTLYEAPFTMLRTPDDYISFETWNDHDKAETLAGIESDLSRFIPQNIMAVFKAQRFQDLLSSVQDVFVKVKQGLS